MLRKDKFNVKILWVFKLSATLLAFMTVVYFVCASSIATAISPSREKEVQERIQKILSSQEFTHSKNQISILKIIGDWIKRMFEKYFKNLKMPDLKLPFQDSGLPTGAVIAIKILGVLIIVAIALILVYFIFKNIRASRYIKQKEDSYLMSVLKEPSIVEQKALEYAKMGDYRQGLRFLYIAFIIRLNEQNIVKIDKSKTNRQYLKEMLNNGFTMYKLAVEFTHAFNEYWYGNRTITKEDFAHWYGKYTLLAKEGGQ